jgi:hypothetical protein
MADVKTVWVLGAGASRAAVSRMPLVGDFMDVAFSLGRFSDEPGQRFLDAICEDFGYTRTELRANVNIEELLTMAACDAAWEGSKSETERDTQSLPRAMGALATLSSLQYMIAGVLFELQRDGLVVQSLHDRLVEQMREGDSVISYNYDLLVDFALSRANKATPANYAIEFSNALDGAEFGPSELEPYETLQPGPIDLLKLHGSLNWLQLKHEELRSSAEFRTTPHPMFYLRDAYDVAVPPGASGWGFSLERDEYKHGEIHYVELVPVIVPPTFDKAEVWRARGGLLRRLWSRAKTALTGCDRVVLIGHSLREADYQTRWLFRTALAQRAPRPEIAIVNPSPDDRRRLHLFFESLGSVQTFKTVDDLLQTRPAV